jgi:hypothetical protein
MLLGFRFLGSGLKGWTSTINVHPFSTYEMVGALTLNHQL